MAVPFYISTNNTQGAGLSKSSPTLVIFCVFDYSHPSGSAVVVSICISPITNEIEHLYMCLLAICLSFLEIRPLESFAPFESASLSLMHGL
jgi:hypothetical protein